MISEDSNFIIVPHDIFVPALEDKQSKKNPFRKCNKSITFTPAVKKVPHSRYTDTTLNVFKIQFGSNLTMARARPELVKAVSNKGSLPEIEAEGPYDCTADVVKKEGVLDELRASDYRATMSQEMEFNFSVLRHFERVEMWEVRKKAIRLGPRPQRSTDKTLVLDLDDTLIHTFSPSFDYSNFDVDRKAVQAVTCVDPARLNTIDMKVVVRPYATQFLKKLSKAYEIIIFTAAQQFYADPIIDLLDPDRQFVSHRLYRQACIGRNKFHVKDLRVIADREVDKMVIVDNCVFSFASQMCNGIHVDSYYGQRNDTCLEKLVELLIHVSKAESVVNELKEIIKLEELYEWYIDQLQTNKEV